MTEPNNMKPFGGTIEFWCRHIFTEHLPKDFLEQKRAEDPNFSAEIVTGQVVEDKLLRWKPGDAMQTTIIVNFDEESLLIETKNTIYKLTGPGRVSTAKPERYDFEVGKTILLLSDAKGLKIDDSESFIVYPKTTSS
jgi:hypothetical protein